MKMKKKLVFVILLIMCLSFSAVALAYPTVGTSSRITLPKTYSSGEFANYHFPTRYFKGSSSGFEIELNSATVGGTDIDIYTYRRATSLGNGNTWQYHQGSSTDTTTLGICSFTASSSNYYCYKLTKTTSGTINVGYTVR